MFPCSHNLADEAKAKQIQQATRALKNRQQLELGLDTLCTTGPPASVLQNKWNRKKQSLSSWGGITKPHFGTTTPSSALRNATNLAPPGAPVKYRRSRIPITLVADRPPLQARVFNSGTRVNYTSGDNSDSDDDSTDTEASTLDQGTSQCCIHVTKRSLRL